VGRSEELTPRLIRRDAWKLGGLVALFGGALMVVLILTSGSDDLFRSDALYFRIVAENPFGHSHQLFVHGPLTGDAYRYGRMLYPFTAWLLAVGHAPWVRWTLPIVDIVSLGVTAALAAELVARRGVDVGRALVILFVPGVWLSVSIAFSEVFVLALLLLLFLLVIDGRTGWAFVVAALALLARETAAIAVIPMALVALRARRWGEAGAWAATVVPLLGWWTWVHHRVGEWPPLDPSLSRREALSYPLGGVIHVVQEGTDAGHWFTFLLGAVTVAAAVWVFMRARWYPIAMAALLFGVLIVCLGPNAYRYPGEAIRLMTPAQCLLLLCFAASGRTLGVGGDRWARTRSTPSTGSTPPEPSSST